VDRKQALPSVRDDWAAWLPLEKAQAFDAYVQNLDTIYMMFSVALNEAMELRRARTLNKSYRAVGMTATLCMRLSVCLNALLRSLSEHAKHYGTIPNVASLDPSNFHGGREQRTARMSDLLSRVLLTQRSKFLHKVGTLGEMATDLGKDFRIASENLALGTSVDTEGDWDVVDAAHYDLNTCLREAIVLLKSFLVILPADQLAAFQKTVRSEMHEAPDTLALPGSDRRIRTRRMASVGGE
jgi:hypothetical protein